MLFKGKNHKVNYFQQTFLIKGPSFLFYKKQKTSLFLVLNLQPITPMQNNIYICFDIITLVSCQTLYNRVELSFCEPFSYTVLH